jgi:hypothetical protein
MRLVALCLLLAQEGPPKDGAPTPNQHLPFRDIFNGQDLSGWKADDEARKHWTAKDGLLCFDGKGKTLWTEREYGDFCLLVTWRLTATPVEKPLPMVLPDGTEEKEDDGKPVTRKVKDAGESGILLRGSEKAEVNIWCWPVGSGEIHGYRIDPATPPEIRKACTPMRRNDHAPGEWNNFYISTKGEYLAVNLNGVVVVDNPKLSGLQARGPVGLKNDGAPIEFKRIAIFEYRNR